MLAGLVLGSCTATREQQVEDDLGDFRAWVNDFTASVADRTEEDWKRAREDFSKRTQELDRKQENFSDELKQDYQNLKQEFQDADEKYKRSHSAGEMEEWEQNLLGEWATTTLNETNVEAAYEAFMERVRVEKENWTNEDWEMAKRVLERLNERKDAISGNIPTGSEVKIKALQMEFRTLETAADL
ncbi:hypothetical protein SAMN05421739_10631 [Pontibacter chinhatensis]|uniref:Uncharacterized protein n=1 Tax=Pontibacter chinhatensis TaxID=1436961 RepID=A0A1I2XH42_9BACT|nr:hypothetical protein SAMN05421739_10631 [Pontibacter chinhatensis]